MFISVIFVLVVSEKGEDDESISDIRFEYEPEESKMSYRRTQHMWEELMRHSLILEAEKVIGRLSKFDYLIIPMIGFRVAVSLLNRKLCGCTGHEMLQNYGFMYLPPKYIELKRTWTKLFTEDLHRDGMKYCKDNHLPLAFFNFVSAQASFDFLRSFEVHLLWKGIQKSGSYRDTKNRLVTFNYGFNKCKIFFGGITSENVFLTHPKFITNHVEFEDGFQRSER